MFFQFANPFMLLGLLLLPLLVLRELRRRGQGTGRLSYSRVSLVRETAGRRARAYYWLRLSLRLGVIGLGVVALARPQSGVRGEEITTEGIDIVLALDVSSSMLAEDIEPNRAEAAKAVAESFIAGRRNDRIGLVIFAGQAYTQCPLTLDHGILFEILEGIEVGVVEDGTAIGMGLGVAANRLKESLAKSKVIVLLTDGRNNRGELDPRTAAQLAKEFDIKIYAVGAGKEGTARYPVDDPVFGRRYVQIDVDIDEAMLKEISSATGGKYFRATDREQLEEIYREIDRLEKSEIEVTEFKRYSELFRFPLGGAIGLFLFEVFFGYTKWQKLP